MIGFRPLQTQVELVKQPRKKVQIGAALQRCTDVLPALAGAAVAVAAAVLAGRSGRFVKTEAPEVTSQQTKARLCPSQILFPSTHAHKSWSAVLSLR